MNRRKATLLLCSIEILFVAHAWYLRCVAEDAFITFRFAENLALGHGFVWNIGEPPVEGFTNFLWVVLCAGRSGWALMWLSFLSSAALRRASA